MPEMTLTPESSDQEVEDWIGRCIQMTRKEGKGAEEAAGMCYSMARQATGKESGMMSPKKG